MNANNQSLHDLLTEHYNETIENFGSPAAILFDHYSESNNATNPKITVTLKKLREQLAEEDTETIMNTVFELCSLHEESGFLGGFNIGFALAKELSSLE